MYLIFYDAVISVEMRVLQKLVSPRQKSKFFSFTHVVNEKVLNPVDFLPIYYVYMYVKSIDLELLILSDLIPGLIRYDENVFQQNC